MIRNENGVLGEHPGCEGCTSSLRDRTGHALIGTSANLSSHLTCRSGVEAFAILDGRVDLVLDGGVCTGPGATTVDITEPSWRVIREGAIPEKEIAEALHPG